MERIADGPVPEPVSVEKEPAAELQASDLPDETELPAGEPQAVPDWLGDVEDAAPDVVFVADEVEEVAETFPDDIPDWLAGEPAEEVVSGDDIGALPDWMVDAEVAPDDVPDWLVETLTSTSEQETVSIPPVETIPEPVVQEPEPTPALVVQEPVPTPSQPPVPVHPVEIDVAATLDSAREKVKAGDVDGSLLDYEAVVRANAQLEIVVGDLFSLSKEEAHRKNPAVYRVLGDGLMRQGKLQEALKTYQSALNML